MDGFLNINKPRRKTSRQGVDLVRSLSGEKRVGHGGTLDPEAEGVLPILLGKATRLMPFLQTARKLYCAEIELGVTTDTLDAEGKVISQGDPSSVTPSQVLSLLPHFLGEIEQIPPVYSAVRFRGQRLYRLARAGAGVEPAKRKVTIYHLELINWSLPRFTLKIECGKGTYIRSLARDMGDALGCGAHLAKLVRLRNGPFHLEDAISWEEMEAAFRYGFWKELVYPLDTLFLSWPAAIFQGGEKLAHGRPVSFPPPPEGEWCRAYSSSGVLAALLRFEGEAWHPTRVFLP